MGRCWDVDSDKRPSFTEIVSQFHTDELVPEECWLKEESGYVLLGPETEKTEEDLDKDKDDSNNDNVNDRESLLNAILTHFQKTPQASYVADTLMRSTHRRGSQPVAEKPDLEYYMDMTSRSTNTTSVFINHVVSLGEGESEGDHVTLLPDHVTEDGRPVMSHEQSDSSEALPRSNSDYILMQSAESARPPSQH